MATDRANPAGVQVLTEQLFAPRVAVRTWLVVRHEPLWAPGEIEARGGGVAGARSAVLSATLRLADHLCGRPLNAQEVRALLRQLGTAGNLTPWRDAWGGQRVVHSCLATPGRGVEWDALTHTLPRTSVERAVTSRTTALATA